MPDTSFSSLPLKSGLLENLQSLGYASMTDIQAQSLPHILAGADLIGQSKTGSGKTAAFALGLLQKLDVKRFRIQALVLCPTRELADQVAGEIRRLGRSLHNIKVLTLCGGVPLGPQIGSLEHGAHIIVGTPGRIEDHLGRNTLDLAQVEVLVLDEADRMLEMGFQESLDAIIDTLPAQRQTLLFSASYPAQIQQIAQRVMQEPVMVRVEAQHDELSIEQHFYQVASEEERITALKLLLQHYQPGSALVFCSTRRDVDQVTQALRQHDFSALALHGEMEQRERDQTLVRFSNNSASILVATDVAARGLDIAALDAVINYHIARDSDTHLHRVGRTGRAGSSGIACSLFTEREGHKLARLNVAPDQAEPLPERRLLDQKPYYPPMVSLQIDGGKKQKLRAGDILGALTGADGIAGDQVGKITITANQSYVAVTHAAVRTALQKLTEGKLKGRSFRVRKL